LVFRTACAVRLCDEGEAVFVNQCLHSVHEVEDGWMCWKFFVEEVVESGNEGNYEYF